MANPNAYSATILPRIQARPGDRLVRRYVNASDTIEEVVLRPTANGFEAYDANGQEITMTAVEMLAAIGAADAALSGEDAQVALGLPSRGYVAGSTFDPNPLTFSRISQGDWRGFLDDEPDLILRDEQGHQVGSTGVTVYQCAVARGASGGVEVDPTANTVWAAYFGRILKTPFVGIELTPESILAAAAAQTIDFGFSTAFGETPLRYAYCRYDAVGNTIKYIFRGASGGEIVSATAAVPAGLPYRMGFGIHGHSLSVWWQDTEDADWRVVGGAYNLPAGADFRVTSDVALLQPLVGGTRTGGTGTHLFSRIRVGSLKGMGIANPSILTFDDGQPVVDQGRVYFIANATHPAGSDSVDWSIPASNLCVWSVDPRNPSSVRKLASCAFTRGANSQGENSGCWVFDRETRTFIWWVPTWGTFASGGTVSIVRYETTDLPRGNYLFAAGVAQTVPTGTTYAVWDPTACRKADGTWVFAYSRSNTAVDPWGAAGFGPVVCEGPDLDSLVVVRDIFADVAEGYSSASTGEGGKLVNFGDGSPWFIIGVKNAGADCIARFYEPSTYALSHNVTDPWLKGSVANHPGIIPMANPAGGVDFIWLGFGSNNKAPSPVAWNYSWGRLRSAVASTSASASWFPPRLAPTR